MGFGGLAYGGGLRHIAIDGVEPTPENVLNDTNPISRYLFLLTATPPQGTLKKFINFVLSSKGQEIARKKGFVPL